MQYYKLDFHQEVDPVVRHLATVMRGPGLASSNRPRYVLLIQRQNRRILNRQELIGALQDRGCPVQVVSAESVTLDEMIHLVSGAAVLLGVHGAGLTNLVFLDERASVVEVRLPFGPTEQDAEYCGTHDGSIHEMVIFHNLALAAGVVWNCYDPPWTLNKQQVDQHKPPRQRDAIVDVNELAQLIHNEFHRVIS